jgi:hypothetical protein
VDVELRVGLEDGLVGQRLVADLVERVRGVGDELAEEDLLVRVKGVDDQREELVDLRLCGGGMGAGGVSGARWVRARSAAAAAAPAAAAAGAAAGAA